MAVVVSEPAPGVFLAQGIRSNWCVIRDGDAITLVDAAWPRDLPAVLDSLRLVGVAPGQVEAIVLTHAHRDHLGVTERLHTDHGSRVHAHVDEVGHATGEWTERVRVVDLVVRMWRPSVLVFAFDSIRRGGLSPTPVSTVEPFVEGPLDVPGGLVAVPTPGHTSGHCSFHIPSVGAVLTGDALVNEHVPSGRPGVRLMPGIFTHDEAQADASLDRLAALAADVVIPGHGDALRMPIAEAVTVARNRRVGAQGRR